MERPLLDDGFMVERAARFVGAVVVGFGVLTSGCAAPEDDWEEGSVQSQGIGSSTKPAARTEDLELEPGEDLVPIEVPWSSVEDYQKEAGITGNELDELLAPEEAATTTTVQTNFLNGIGKLAISPPRTFTPSTIEIGRFLKGPSLALANKGLYALNGLPFGLDSFLAGLLPLLMMAAASQDCLKPGAAVGTVPAAQAPKLVAKFGGSDARYGLCVAPTFVTNATGAQMSVRTYIDKAAKKIVALRNVVVLNGKSTVADIPRVF